MNVFLLFDEDAPDRREAGSALARWAEDRGHELESAFASEAGLKPCLGCFGCWIKTPGRCVIKGDGGEALLSFYVRSDLVVLLGATPYGCFSQPIKAAIDRWLPTLHPYFRRFRGEMHHVQRYPKPARIVSASFGEAGTAEESTYRELLAAFCDNAASPRQTRPFRYAGDGEALAAWIEEELAS
jgi:multimeric flavodoxin WrbA